MNSQKDFVFGIQSVMETIKAGTEIDKILMQLDLQKSSKFPEIHQLAKERQIPISRVPLAKLNQITRKNHQGLIAFISSVRFVSLDNIIRGVFEEGKNPLILILDRVTDVRNFGAICRTAECAGVHAIVIPTKGAAQLGNDAMKTSSGALNFIPVCREVNLAETVQYLQESGIQVIACTEKTDDTLYENDFNQPCAIIMGSEENGISNDLIRKADRLAKIPIQGQIESLNVSVAAGVILYEVLRQRKI